MQNCMIDIETLGTRPGSVILSIGAVEFDVHDGLGREFYVEISRYSSEHAGFRTDQATLDWWSKQEGEAQTLLERTGRGGLMPHRALIELQNWLPPDPLVWGCGAAFDNAMIAEACAIVGRPPGGRRRGRSATTAATGRSGRWSRVSPWSTGASCTTLWTTRGRRRSTPARCCAILRRRRPNEP